MEDKIYGMSLNDFIAVAASKSHTPGGGNVSAVVATLAASMVAMVGNLTVANKKYEEFHAQAQAQVDRLMGIIEKLKELTNADIAAFDHYMGCFKLPKDTDGQKKARAAALEDAAQKATLVPLEICQCCLEIIKEADELSKYGNKMAISDVGVGAMVGEAALRACMLSVDINIPSIKDQAFVAKVKAARENLFVQAEEHKLLALARVKEKMS
ncbi:MAG: cyclodeaminase/cyclohydrolase family protein [Desulfarculus sp.]|nr:cyclodeaminase/cyclohydrolase family protein [Desulfarculus sp.]